MGKEYSRSCPECGKKLFYTRNKNRNYAEKNKKVCASCRRREVVKRPEVIAKNKKKWKLLSIKYKGEGNPFYGKKHSDSVLKKLQKVDKGYTQTKEFKDKSVKRGRENGMYGKTIYGVWVEKYGVDIADEKMAKLRSARSQNACGKNNPMYGKPSPQGSGNGWSGWYKGWFFRSIRELSYVIKNIEANNYTWRTAEAADLKIPYRDYKGEARIYFADFLVEDKELIEVKPQKLQSSLTVRKKQAAAKRFCKKRKYVYKLVDVAPLTEGEIKDL